VAALHDRLAPTVVLDLDEVGAWADSDAGGAVTEPWRDPETLAAILFTSGSDGAPKGVLHTQATLAAKASTMVAVHGLTADDVVLMPAPCAHISGLLNGITLPGLAGARTVFMARWDPETALGIIERERVTFMIGPPTFFVSLMDAPGFTSERVASLRLVSSGGAGVSPAFVERARRTLGARVKRTYGSTEAPTVATAPADDDGAHDATHDGRAIPPAELRVAANGELLVRGPEVCVGYLDPDATARAFDANGWFHTGDLATIDADGWLTIIGRTKDVIIRGGENIAASAVEATLEAHPAIRAAAVVGAPDERLGERVAAFVVTDGSAIDVPTVAAWFAERGVARFTTPEIVVVVDALPLLATGKPDKTALRTRIATLGRSTLVHRAPPPS
jgi:cyclohexanecarboxylate-CoA ligase